ncbi:hypothetical protein FHS07_001798 [Microbacterium proteolyticum]|uniref:GIY-YIG catalytic domain-containing protein n=1 Tax=Microbacterium proteolyticum TaxID=1572644 RepID=A0A7W5CI37_9MICO|nr:hypothetical protein [Microbacterium proteolyticum]
MTDDESARAALRGPRWSITDAAANVPDSPGVYAIYGNDQAWSQLGLERRADALLYVGKAEDSLVRRELRGHFAAATQRARTGSSTVRRSFAALLHDTLGLRGVPRNLAKPGYFGNFGLSSEHDVLLTGWMHEHLTLAVWPASGLTGPLRYTESAIIIRWTPPLNLAGNPRPAPGLSAARARMAAEARAWSAGQRLES